MSEEQVTDVAAQPFDHKPVDPQPGVAEVPAVNAVVHSHLSDLEAKIKAKLDVLGIEFVADVQRIVAAIKHSI